jgi:hypothetical protein
MWKNRGVIGPSVPNVASVSYARSMNSVQAKLAIVRVLYRAVHSYEHGIVSEQQTLVFGSKCRVPRVWTHT